MYTYFTSEDITLVGIGATAGVNEVASTAAACRERSKVWADERSSTVFEQSRNSLVSATQESSVFSVDGKFWNIINLCLNMGKTAESTLSIIMSNACIHSNENLLLLCAKSCLKVLNVYGNKQVKTKYFRDVYFW